MSIAQSTHLPPEFIHVPAYMQELVGFMNRADAPKYDLMKVALAHHRFGWIHPFGNGNGRTVRLLTYSLLIKYGFNVKTSGRVLNPTAVFAMTVSAITRCWPKRIRGLLRARAMVPVCSYRYIGGVKESR